MRFTAQAKLETWAHASRVQSDEVTYGLQLGADCAGDSSLSGCSPGSDGARRAGVHAVEHVAREGRVAAMSRSLDVVRLSGDEYDRLMDEREILRQEASRAWREVDAIAKERDDHHRWRKELADTLGEVEKQRDVLARTVNTQEAELQALRKVAQAFKEMHDNAEEWECDGLGLWAQHGFWEAVDEAMEALAPNVRAKAPAEGASP